MNLANAKAQAIQMASVTKVPYVVVKTQIGYRFTMKKMYPGEPELTMERKGNKVQITDKDGKKTSINIKAAADAAKAATANQDSGADKPD